jgi:hypothetical protein
VYIRNQVLIFKVLLKGVLTEEEMVKTLKYKIESHYAASLTGNGSLVERQNIRKCNLRSTFPVKFDTNVDNPAVKIHFRINCSSAENPFRASEVT